MRLININTLEFEEFLDERQLPPYAILSHTWDGKEVQYHHFLHQERCRKDDRLDFTKIDFTCGQAKKNSLQYAWIDTCCIDKTSSAELSEAINSMFRWYQKSAVCYVFLSDVEIFKLENGGPAQTPDSKNGLLATIHSQDETVPPSVHESSSHGQTAAISTRYAHDQRLLWHRPLVTRSGFSDPWWLSTGRHIGFKANPSVGVGLVVVSARGSMAVPACFEDYPQERRRISNESQTRSENPRCSVADRSHLVGQDVQQRLNTFKESRWFTRGWTLQELLAPTNISFYDRDGLHLGSRYDLFLDIKLVTGIPGEVLAHELPLSKCSIAMRMSWASKRRTTRIEDEAYCLLGLFDVNMPLLYGEGDKAFLRFQEEIIRQSTDQSILVYAGDRSAIFAASPKCFEYSAPILPVTRSDTRSERRNYEMTNSGLRIALRLYTSLSGEFVLLDCIDRGRPGYFIGLPLQGRSYGTEVAHMGLVPVYNAGPGPACVYIRYDEDPGHSSLTPAPENERCDVLIRRGPDDGSYLADRSAQIRLHSSAAGFSYRVEPPHRWNEQTQTMSLMWHEVRVVITEEASGRTYVLHLAQYRHKICAYMKGPADVYGLRYVPGSGWDSSWWTSYKSHSSRERLKISLQSAWLSSAERGRLLTIELVPAWLWHFHGRPRSYTKIAIVKCCVLPLYLADLPRKALRLDGNTFQHLIQRLNYWRYH